MLDTVRGICDSFPKDYSRQKALDGEPPTELWDAMAEKGYLGVNLPEDWGGGRLGMSGLALVGEEISAAGKSLLLIVVSPAIVGSILSRHGTDEQRERWLRGIAAGTTKIAFAITEPDAGTNTHNLATKATRDDGGYRLRGQKVFISGVEDADALLVVARTGTHTETGRGLLSLFIVDTDVDGLERQVIPTAPRGADKQWTLFFEDVFVPEERLVGPEHGGVGAGLDGPQPPRVLTRA